MQTKKDFKAIATILKNNCTNDGGFKRDLIADLCEFFKNDNPNFQEDLFLKAVFNDN